MIIILSAKYATNKGEPQIFTKKQYRNLESVLGNTNFLGFPVSLFLQPKIGSSDITHIINIPYLKKITKQLNLKVDYTSQRNFLINLGIMKRAEILATNKKFLEKANIFYRINRLIDKSQMGEIFKILHIYKNKKFKLGFL